MAINRLLPTSFNLTDPPPITSWSTSSQPSGAMLGVIAFFIGTCVLHIITAHAPVALRLSQSLGLNIAMILSPITTGIDSIYGIVLFVRHLNRGIFFRQQFPSFQYGISAGAVAILVPNQYGRLLPRSYLGWRKVENETLVAMKGIIRRLTTTDTSDGRAMLFVIPRASRVVDSRYDHLSPHPTSNKVNIWIALIQLIWSAYTAYMQYGPLIRDRGISSPFLIALPYSYMNFVNLIANLVEGSYQYITVLAPIDRPVSNQNTVVTFADWLTITFPGVEFDEAPSIEVWPFTIHHLVSTSVMFIWIGMLTGFNVGPGSSHCFILLGVFLDPILHAVVTAFLSRFPPRSAIVQQAICGAERIICWSFFIGGCLVAGKVLYSIYSGITSPFCSTLTVPEA